MCEMIPLWLFSGKSRLWNDIERGQLAGQLKSETAPLRPNVCRFPAGMKDLGDIA